MAFGRRRRPSLIQTAARTALITGTAAATSNAVHGRAAAKQQAADAATAPVAEATPAPTAVPASAPAAEDIIARLERLAALHQAGALTDAEFGALKTSAIAGL